MWTILLSLCLLTAPPLDVQMGASREALERERAVLRARGEPMTAAGLANLVGDVPDAANPYVEFSAAFKALPAVGEEPIWVRLDNLAIDERPQIGQAADDATWAEVAVMVKRHAAVFKPLDNVLTKLRPEVKRVRADFGLNLAEPEDGLLMNVILPELGEARALSQWLGWRARLAAHENRHDDIERMIGLADAMGASHPFLLGRLVAVAIEGYAVGCLNEITPHLIVGDGAGELPREQAEALVALLLDRDADWAAWRLAVVGEVAGQQSAVDFVLSGGQITGDFFDDGLKVLNLEGNGNFLDAWAARVTAAAEGVTLLEIATPLLDAAAAHELPRATFEEADRRVAAAIDRDPQSLVSLLSFPWLGAGEGHFAHRSRREQAAVLLASRLYELDHNRPPPSSAALVPNYLPFLPNRLKSLPSNGRSHAFYEPTACNASKGASASLDPPRGGAASWKRANSGWVEQPRLYEAEAGSAMHAVHERHVKVQAEFQ